MRAVFAGDVFLGGEVTERGALVDLPAYQLADIRVFNLEQAVADDLKPLDKGTLYTRTERMRLLDGMAPTAVTLANNHVHDLGPDGVVKTIQSVRDAGVLTAGAGGSLEESRGAITLWPGVVLLSYCDYGRSYLKNVLVATDSTPGVSPLRLENILEDLERLKTGERAILYFHWGQEHVWLPPAEDVRLARELLCHSSVLHIIGMHAHRAQGEIKHGDKRAYMGIGNFLFPNFMIEPPIQLSSLPSEEARFTTRAYHPVTFPTLKKWLPQNRRSIVVEVDTETGRAQHHWALQPDDSARVVPLPKLSSWKAETRHRVLSYILELPAPAYRVLARVENRVSWAQWRMRVVVNRARQAGIKEVVRRARGKISR